MIYLMLITCALTLIGEFFCKLASQNVGTLRYAYGAIPMFLWGGCAWLWIKMYEMKSMSEVIGIYSPSLLVLTATMAVLMFGEPLTWKLVAAYVLIGLIFWLLK